MPRPTPPRWTRGDVGREIGAWILAEIKEALELAGIHGRKINAGNIVGTVPQGASKITVQKDGVQVGEPVAILNFIGTGFVVTYDEANNRVNIGNTLATGTLGVVDYDLNNVTDVSGDRVVVG